MGAEGIVYVNGRLVVASEVDSAKHRFLGMFREPTMSPETRGPRCRCGMLIQYEDEVLTPRSTRRSGDRRCDAAQDIV